MGNMNFILCQGHLSFSGKTVNVQATWIYLIRICDKLLQIKIYSAGILKSQIAMVAHGKPRLPRKN
jgi:hypothetical protein